MAILFWGFALLLFFGIIILAHLYLKGSFRTPEHYCLKGIPANDPHFLPTVASMSDSLITEGAVLRFWSDIDAIQTARLKLIETAQTIIQFETFKMDPGKRADAFADALIQKASEEVTVQILADSYGASDLPDTYWSRLKNSGIDVRFFNPFSARAPLDFIRRNHRKLLVIDHQVAMVGGAGIADCWDGDDQYDGLVPWCDFEVQWTGTVAGLLTGFFGQHWLSAGGCVDLRQHVVERSPEHSSPILITPGEDPSVGDSPIRSLFQLCILSAQRRLWIASPYLLPDDATCDMLAQVQNQGVDVRILTMGPKSDKPYVYYVSRQRYKGLLLRDIKIFEYQPSMMHAKLVLIDDQWVSLGSSNLDPRSFFHNDELNLCTNDQHLIQDIEHFFKQRFEDSHRVHYKEWKRRSPKERIVGSLGNFFYWQL